MKQTFVRNVREVLPGETSEGMEKQVGRERRQAKV